MIELTIKVSNDEKTQKKKVIHDGDLFLSRSDPFIRSLIIQSTAEFQDPVDDVVIIARMMGI